LKKADNFRKAYNNFDIDRIEVYTLRDRNRSLKDVIIRNRHINAAIEKTPKNKMLKAEYKTSKHWLISTIPPA
jgi:DNA-3-methyladenine glycosylase I